MFIFNTKWKQQYEKIRGQIEDKGWDVFISEPFDLVDLKIPPETLLAMSDEGAAHLKWKRTDF